MDSGEGKKKGGRGQQKYCLFLGNGDKVGFQKRIKLEGK